MVVSELQKAKSSKDDMPVKAKKNRRCANDIEKQCNV
jgi:hypothetical protein